MAERPADNRKTAVRYRAGEPANHRQETSMTTIKKPGRLTAAPSHLVDAKRPSPTDQQVPP